MMAIADDAKPQRIAKLLARAGLCSRREAERLIAEGRVAVNGTVLTSPAVTVTRESRIIVDGRLVDSPDRTRLWRYHKPAGLLTTTRDPQGRPTIFEKLPAELPRVLAIGRLDLSSEGLLLLTNDGELKRRLEHPETGWLRRYRVRVHVRSSIDASSLAKLRDGVTVEGVRYGPIEAALDSQRSANAWLTMGLREGRNREVRRVCEHLGTTVNRLIRISYGPFQLGNLPRGAIDEVPARVLRDQLGKNVTDGGRRAHRRR